jgi:hypothetical protein
MLVGELCDLELRVLADEEPRPMAVGPSLADLFAQEVNPALFAAAALHGRGEFLADQPFIPKFAALQRDDPTTFDAWMTIARTVLHGAPRGFSAEVIARRVLEVLGEQTHKVPNQAVYRACPIILDEIFPELRRLGLGFTNRFVGEWLSLDKRDAFRFFAAYGEGFAQHLRDVIAGRRSDPDLLGRLRELCTDERKKAMLGAGSPSLFDEIFRRPRRTGYGRVRGMLEYHQAEANNLVDATDDIRKSVLYELVAAGYELAAFAGDEFVLLIPDPNGHGGERIEETTRDVKALVEGAIGGLIKYLPGRCRVTPSPAW